MSGDGPRLRIELPGALKMTASAEEARFQEARQPLKEAVRLLPIGFDPVIRIAPRTDAYIELTARMSTSLERLWWECKMLGCTRVQWDAALSLARETAATKLGENNRLIIETMRNYAEAWATGRLRKDG